MQSKQELRQATYAASSVGGKAPMAAAQAQAVIMVQGARKIVEWHGGVHICPLCNDYSTDDPHNLQQHLARSRHRTAVSVLATEKRAYLQDQYAEDLGSSTCKWCQRTFATPESGNGTQACGR